jgi:hypothetical protein
MTQQEAEMPGAKEMVSRMDHMARTIETLSERIRVLERLAAHDEAKLSAEIEKLRSTR